MVNLLKSDFYKLKKEKAHLILLIVMLGITLLTFLLMLAVRGIGESIAEPSGGTVSGEALSGLATMAYISCINISLYAVLSCSLFITGDFRNRTVNLKILTGNDRVRIFFSTVIVNLCYFAAIYIVNALFSLALGGMFFGGFGDQLGFILKVTLLMFPLLLSVVTVAFFVSFSLKTALAIVVNILIIQLLAGIISIFDAFLSQIAFMDFLFSVIPYSVLNRLTNNALLGAIGSESAVIDLAMVLKTIIGSVVMAGLALMGGFLVFRKKELN